MMKSITRRFIQLTTIGKLAVVIVSLMGFASVVSAYNDPGSTDPVQPTQPAPRVVQKPETTTEPEILNEVLPFATTTVENPALERGKTQVKVKGVNGVKSSIFYITRTNGVEVSRLHIATEVTTEPVNEIVEIGTSGSSIRWNDGSSYISVQCDFGKKKSGKVCDIRRGDN